MIDYRVTHTLEWLNGNMHRNYPLLDSAVPVFKTGDDDKEYYLPTSLITDLQLIVPYVEGLDAGRFFISSVVKQVDSWLVTIGYCTDDSDPEAKVGFDCAISAPIPDGLQYTGSDLEAHAIELAAITTTPSPIGPSYTYGIPEAYSAMRGLRGTIYIGSCTDMSSLGALQFKPASTPIMPTCVFIESPRTEISSVRVVDTYGTDTTFTNDIVLRAADGIKISVDENNVVSFTLDQDYLDTLFATAMNEDVGTVIKTINGKTPTGDGEFNIMGMDCTLIGNADHGITISNPCSKPCCDSGGADTAEVAAVLEQLSADKTVLENYYTDLATKINSMQSRLASLIASRT